ncbi:hypothetical protein HCCG_02103 [Helicobacter cinaedi CCUG 18818 = ATCC BAA-847]|uniref:Uncharacterized protein n=1 Tax=Helicobacter cinaedi CCUG 18818 = ATCC BAA-847 TaxID=537971 RepID=A0ABN0BEC2_9HELI|nr:hypothetical protein HCCG_02103 [Helicobacter cinaedi CCUG 18818 = ATCC BAA-847]
MKHLRLMSRDMMACCDFVGFELA